MQRLCLRRMFRRMFTKLEQRSWLKIEAGRGKTATECYQGLVEVCGTAALPYRTVARWVQAFRAGRQNATDQPRPRRPSATEAQVSSVATLLETDGRWTIRELACETGLSHTTVLHILKEHCSSLVNILLRPSLCTYWQSTGYCACPFRDGPFPLCM